MGPPQLSCFSPRWRWAAGRDSAASTGRLGSGAGRHPRTELRKVAMAKPDEDEPTRPSLREAAADKTRAVTSATADVMRDAFDKVIESIDDAAKRQQQKAAVKEEKAAAKQERKAEEKAQKAEEKAQKAAAKHGRGAAAGEDRDPPAEP
jgi:hypothetical protein